MRKTSIAIMMAGLMGIGLTATTATAEEAKYEHASKHQPFGMEVTGDIGVASQYVWRGVTQTNGKSAVQGDMGVGLGDFSASVWFSNAYPSPAPQFATRDVVEFDWTLDYSGSVGDTGLGYSLGGIGYTYLYDSASNFPEVYAGLSYGPLSLVGYYNIKSSLNKTYLKGDAWIDLGVSSSLGGIDLSGTVSFVRWKKDATNRATVDHFKSGVSLVTLGVSKDIQIANVTLTPSLTGTIPVIKKASDGNRYIYGTAAKNEFVAALNFSY